MVSPGDKLLDTRGNTSYCAFIDPSATANPPRVNGISPLVLTFSRKLKSAVCWIATARLSESITDNAISATTKKYESDSGGNARLMPENVSAPRLNVAIVRRESF